MISLVNSIYLILYGSYILAVTNNSTLDKVADLYLEVLTKEEINTDVYIHYICKKNNEYFISELSNKKLLKCNKVISHFIYKRHYFILIDNNSRGNTQICLNSKFKTLTETLRKNEIVLFDPFAIKFKVLNNNLSK